MKASKQQAALLKLATPAINRLHEIGHQMNEKYAERASELRGFALALLADQHVFLWGEPGVAKSAITRDFFNAVTPALVIKEDETAYFEIMVDPASTKEDLFGDWNTALYEKTGVLKHSVQGYLPTSHFAMIDECFNASGSTLKSMQMIINERTFKNKNEILNCPLKMVVGASNEIPTDSTLRAFYDRLSLRYEVKAIQSNETLIDLIETFANAGQLPEVTATLNKGDLNILKKAASMVHVPREVCAVLVEIVRELEKQGLDYVSDRTMISKVTKVIKASAILDGRMTCQVSDLAIVADMAWSNPENISKVKAVVRSLADADADAAQKLYDGVIKTHQKAVDAGMNKTNIKGNSKEAAIDKLIADLDLALNELGQLDQENVTVLDYASRCYAMKKEAARAKNRISNIGLAM